MQDDIRPEIPKGALQRGQVPDIADDRTAGLPDSGRREEAGLGRRRQTVAAHLRAESVVFQTDFSTDTYSVSPSLITPTGTTWPTA